MSDFQKEELTLEETNKLRISLGLKPLAADVADDKDASGDKAGTDEVYDPLKDQDERAARNYEEFQDSLRRKKDEDGVRERIAKAQNRRELGRRLQGRTLGEAEPSTSASADVDAKKWIKAQKKKAKENAERRLREEGEAEEAAAAAAQRGEQHDLSGLRVGHDVDDLDLDEGGEERILTLKDRRVLDDEDDELIDTHLARSEQDRKNQELKKGAKKYTGLDDDEFEEVGGRKKGVLSKYNADVDGKLLDEEEDKGFRLGGAVATRQERTEAKKREAERLLNRQMLDLDYTKNEEVSDYLKEGDVGFKKPKKKRPKVAARIRLDDEDEARAEAGDGDVAMGEARPSAEEKASRRLESSADVFVDDEDLAASLARARRKQAKRTFQKLTPEQLARNLRQQQEAEDAENAAAAQDSGANADAMDAEELAVKAEGGESALTFDDMSEFVRNIQAARQTSPVAAQRAAASEASQHVKQETVQSQQQSNTLDADRLLGVVKTGHEEHSEDEDMHYMDDDAPKIQVKDESASLPVEGSAAEPLVGGGIASALSYVKNQGLMTEITAEQREREQEQRKYDAWLAMRRAEDRVREAELAASKAQGSAKDQATREHENRMRELEDARRAQDKFKDYKPDINIKYHDKFGRELNRQEAWKHLSHTFHGKEAGPKKQNLRLRRIEEERKREKMLAGDTPSGIASAFTNRTEQTGQAHMVLGVGNRNNAPQDMGMLGPNTLSRLDHGKGKERAHAAEQSSHDYDAGTSTSQGRPSDGIDSLGITSMVPRSTTARTKAGFAPVRSQLSANGHIAQAANLSNVQTEASPVPQAPASKFKLAFGKRPAPAENESAANKVPRLDH